MVYHYTKRVILAMLFVNKGPAIYVVSQMVTYLVCDGLKYGFKVLMSRVRQATKDVVKSEV